MQIGKREEFDLNEMAVFVHVVRIVNIHETIEGKKM